MVDVKIGNILDSKANTLVNTVNCVGVMGKGIALEFKKNFPDMFRDYVKRCSNGSVRLGRPYIYKRLVPPCIINFPTKEDWRSVARLHDIEEGLRYLIEHFKEWGITSIAVPPLGCGEGQLEWRIVGPTLYRYLQQLDIPVELFAPFGTPAMETQSSFLSRSNESIIADIGSSASKVKPDWVAIVEILSRIENEPYHWPVGRTTFQKIAYFATEAGFSTDLKYSQGSYGPFASSLKSKITQLVNNGLINEVSEGRMLRVKVGPTYKDAKKAYRSAINERDAIIDRITNLFLRMRTSQAEMAATVHFAAKALSSNGKPYENEVLTYVMEWKQRRKPPFDTSEVAKTIRSLAALGWLEVKGSDNLPVPEESLCDI